MTALRDSDRIALRNFWESKYGAFTYNAPNENGIGTTAYTCRFANEPLSWEMLRDDLCSTGATLIEIPASSPTYTVTSTVLRFPSDALKTALLCQAQQLIPLVRITPRQASYPDIYVSDRRSTVASTLHHARLLQFDGIQQGMGNEADQATFTFGNADRVMRDLANDVDLFRASIEFSLFHVPLGQTAGIKLDLWKGEIIDWSLDAGPEFKVTACSTTVPRFPRPDPVILQILARRLFDVRPQSPSIQPFSSSRWRAGYSEPSSTRSSLPDHC